MSAPIDVLVARAQEILRERCTDGTPIEREDLAIRIARLEQRDAAVVELIEAAKAFDKTYAWHWDRVDGAAVIMPERVPEFEDRAERLTKALARVRGAS